MLGFHALNARDNSLIHWIFSSYAKSDPEAFRRAMQAEAQQIRDLLSSRGVAYDQLKSALVPTPTGVQAVFLYDWLDDPSWNYAVAFAKKYLPHLRADLRTSVFQGDFHDMQGPMPVRELEEALVKARSEQVNWQTQFAVYFNNLRPGDVALLHEKLSEEPRYRGYIDVTVGGPVRDFLARTGLLKVLVTLPVRPLMRPLWS